MNAEIKHRIETFPAMPALCKYLAAHLTDPYVDPYDIAQELRYDPGLTANILKIANSAVYGGLERVDSIQSAIIRLGMKQLFQLVVGVGVSKVLTKRLRGYQLEPEELLSHSVYVAVASEEIAQILGLRTSEMLFTAGLLHDMGKVVLDDFVEKKSAELDAGFRAAKEGFDHVERNALGICHAEVGAAILQRWKFPEELVALVRWHHRPSEAGSWAPMVNIVHVADILSYSEGIGTGIDGLRYNISKNVISTLGLRSSTIEAVASHSLDKVRDLSKLLTGTHTVSEGRST
jgi:putative nucleotidyltransferase with HDIG domain